jgi:hypothetical protein
MSKSVFVSHVFEDRHWIAQIEEWGRQGQLGDVVITGETRDVRAEGDTAIRNHLHPKINGAAVVLVLVGKDTHNHAWADYEVRAAQSLRKRIVVARIPNTTGAPPPSAGGLALVAWQPHLLRAALLG